MALINKLNAIGDALRTRKSRKLWKKCSVSFGWRDSADVNLETEEGIIEIKNLSCSYWSNCSSIVIYTADRKTKLASYTRDNVPETVTFTQSVHITTNYNSYSGSSYDISFVYCLYLGETAKYTLDEMPNVIANLEASTTTDYFYAKNTTEQNTACRVGPLETYYNGDPDKIINIEVLIPTSSSNMSQVLSYHRGLNNIYRGITIKGISGTGTLLMLDFLAQQSFTSVPRSNYLGLFFPDSDNTLIYSVYYYSSSNNGQTGIALNYYCHCYITQEE